MIQSKEDHQAETDLLTVVQVAEALGLSTRRVLRMITEENRFPNVIKLPGETTPYLIPRPDLEAEQKRRQSDGQSD